MRKVIANEWLTLDGVVQVIGSPGLLQSRLFSAHEHCSTPAIGFARRADAELGEYPLGAVA